MSNVKMGILSRDSGIRYAEGTQLRISQKGHDFVYALMNKSVFNKLKNDFKGAPFKILFDISQKLLEQYLKKKVDDIFKV